jgi:3-methyladenine DNA glycosylase AlkD
VTIDERLEALTTSLELLQAHALDADERADVAHQRHNAEIMDIRAELRRGIRTSIQEAMAERGKRQKLEATFDDKVTKLAAAQLITEEKLTQLAAAQLVTEEKLQRFLEWRGKENGGGK